MVGRWTETQKNVKMDSSPSGVLKFNVDGGSKGKPHPTGIGHVLRNGSGDISCSFQVWFKEPNEANALVIREMFRILKRKFSSRLVIRGGFRNVTK